MYAPSGYWGGQPADPETRLAHVEAALHDISRRLEAHVVESAQQIVALRQELASTRVGGSAAAAPSRGWGRGDGSYSGDAGSVETMQTEMYQMRTRMARLEAEFGGFVVGAKAPSAPAGSIFDDEDSDLVMVGSQHGGVLSMLNPLNWADAWSSQPGAGRGGQLQSMPDPMSSLRSFSTDLPADAIVGLESSIWDCALVIILHQGCSALKDPRQQWYLGRFNIVQTWALLSFNIAIQVLFIIAVHSMSTPDPFSDVRDTILDTRLMSGQDFMEMDRRSMSTRIEKTCNNQVYDSLTRTANGISTYLSLEADKGLIQLPGNAICFLAMLFWVVEMTVELRRCADLTLAVMALPNTPQTIIEETGMQHVVKGVTRGHKFLCLLCVLIPRGMISYFLLVFGKRFLAGTVDVGELILNTCALEFVRNVDDMIFEAMATRTLILFTQTAKIFRMDALSQQPLLAEDEAEEFQLAGHIPPRVPRMRGFPTEIINVVVAIMWIVFQSCLGYTDLIQPFVDSASHVYSTICDKNIHFTYLFHPVYGLPVFAQVDHSAVEMVNLRCFYASQYEMVRMRAGFPPETFPPNDTLSSMVNGSHPLCKKHDWLGGNPEMQCPEREFNIMAQLPMLTEQGYYASDQCRDQDVAFTVLRETCLSQTFYIPSSHLGFFEEAQSCRDLAPQCAHTKNFNITLSWYNKLRRLCAKSCGMCTQSEVIASP
mmetsp:Transcript_69926/g.181390  ORF Transcript_69926/g.181390 Transcript_69926/m.181390 type:complete len:711 (+) Transcript_69926:153-2285(+)